VLTVAPRPPLVSRIGLQTYRTAVREAVRSGREADLLAAQRIANSVGARLQGEGTIVRVWARQGGISDEIIAISQLEGSDLIVIGHPNRSAHAFAWGPSIPTEVVRAADAAVLVANRPPEEAGALPRTTLLVVPGKRAAEAALRWLRRAGWLRRAALTLGWGGPQDGTLEELRLIARDTAATVTEIEIQRDDHRWVGELVAPFDLVVLPRGSDWSGVADDTKVPARINRETRAAVLITPR
jgi:nucleotide-binding universal stress UspA family protein